MSCRVAPGGRGRALRVALPTKTAYAFMVKVITLTQAVHLWMQLRSVEQTKAFGGTLQGFTDGISWDSLVIFVFAAGGPSCTFLTTRKSSSQ